MAQSVERKINRLREELERHNRLYYVEAKPEISDLEFDRMMKDLEALEREHPEFDSPDSPTRKVGGEPIEGFQTVEHRLPMLSIDNVYEEDALREFEARIRKLLPDEEPTYAVEYKIDGVALAVLYERGKFVRAATRGDGRHGDDVTHNARTLGGLPLRLAGKNLPEVLEVRGEAYIANSDFAHLRAEQEQADEQPFANPRNATAGSMKLHDPKIAAKRRMRFLAHGIGYSEGASFSTHVEYLKALRQMGIAVTPDVEVRKTMDEVIAHTQEMIENLHTLDVEVDGIVVKVNDFGLRETLGNTSKSPRWLIAYKWEKYTAVTRVERADIQVGKTGTLTPVAFLEPVEIAGTTVSKSSLHNWDEVERLGVMEGDHVVVEKAGKIIPHVLRVEEHLRDGSEKPIARPVECPVCSADVVQDEGGVYLRCANPNCPAQLRETLRFFASRSAMDIDGLGIKLIEQLLEAGLIKSLGDVYRLPDRRDELISLERMGEKSVDNLLHSIDASRSRPVWRLLTGLNIRHVGQSNARVLARRFGSIDRIAEQSEETLAEVDEIGPIIARSVHGFFQSEAGAALVADLRDQGLNFGTPVEEAEVEESTGVLTGKTLVVTGTLERFTRDEIKELIQQHGGKASGSVSRRTDFLIAGEEAGSKLEKARQLEIPVLSEDAFLQLLDGERGQ